MVWLTPKLFVLIVAFAILLPQVVISQNSDEEESLPERVLGAVPRVVSSVASGVRSFGSGLVSVFLGEDPEKKPPFWGPKSKEGKKENTSIRNFEIKVDEKVLRDLKARLRLETSAEGNRLAAPIENTGFHYGMNSDFLKNVTKYWLNGYDWRAREKRLNLYPHYKTTIYGLDIHFQRAKPKNSNKKTRPLLLLHGWPSSFVDFQKVIPLLTEPAYSDVNFELIIPSLPGYGFSDAAAKPGLGTPQMAQIFLKLMRRLGYPKFYVHGADFGAIIATDMATMFPKSVMGLHLSMCFTFHWRSFLKLGAGQVYRGRAFDETEAGRLFPLNKYMTTLLQETGYFHHQTTKPDTLGIALANSPTGLAGYILEKFSTFTNLKGRNRRNGGLLPHFNLDELLDSVMIYWVTNTITSSMRLYYEAFSNNPLAYTIDTMPVNVPTACLNMPEDFWNSQNEYLVNDKYPQIVHYTKARKGGHFTAIEVPDILAQDAVDFYNRIEMNGTKF
jgi:juvenile hormone epoxide hydrolase